MSYSLMNNPIEPKMARNPVFFEFGPNADPIYPVATPGLHKEVFKTANQSQQAAPASGSTNNWKHTFTDPSPLENGNLDFYFESSVTCSTTTCELKCPFSFLQSIRYKLGGVTVQELRTPEEIFIAWNDWYRRNQYKCKELTVRNVSTDQANLNTVVFTNGITNYISLDMRMIFQSLEGMNTRLLFGREIQFEWTYALDSATTGLNGLYFLSGDTSNVMATIAYNNIGIRYVLKTIDPYFQKFDTQKQAKLIRNFEPKSYTWDFSTAGNTFTFKMKDFTFLRNVPGVYFFVHNKSNITTYNDADALVHYSHPRNHIALRVRNGTTIIYDHTTAPTLQQRLRKCADTQIEHFGEPFILEALNQDSTVSKKHIVLTYLDLQGLPLPESVEFPLGGVDSNNSNIEVDIVCLSNLSATATIWVVPVWQSVLKLNGSSPAVIKEF
jgi:hypothetical protein